jgi:hypothetical protein
MKRSRLSRGLLTATALTFAGALATLTTGAWTTALASEKTTDAPPRLTVKASPSVAFSPAEISARAALVGGADDYEKYYCPSVEWNWGDGSTSEASADCEPYQAGKSAIERHYFVRHVYRGAGRYRVTFSLKKDGKNLATASAEVIVRPGLGG